MFAVLWSLVDPDHPWSYPDAFPKVLSLAQWKYVFDYTNIIRALATSYSIAPLASLLAFIFALPTSYVLGRKEFAGKSLISNLILLPDNSTGNGCRTIFEQGFRCFRSSPDLCRTRNRSLPDGYSVHDQNFTTSFASIPQDVIDAAENLGAGVWQKIRYVFIPMVLPGLFAGTIFTFITSLEEFNLTFIIGTPTFETVPTILYSFLGIIL